MPDHGAPLRTSLASTAALASLPTLLAVQEMPVGAGDPRRRAIRRGEELLEGLGRLQGATLSGEDDAHCLAELRVLMDEQVERPENVDLADILAEIEVRVAVEIAKREAPG